MSPRGSVVPVLAGGVASVVRLLVATFAFAGVYLGVWGTPGVPAQAPVSASAEVTARVAVRTVVLSSRSTPADATPAVRTPAARTNAGTDATPKTPNTPKTSVAKDPAVRTPAARTNAGTDATPKTPNTPKTSVAKDPAARTPSAGDRTAADPAATGRAVVAGRIAVGEGGALGPCDSPYLARTVVGNEDPRAVVSYAWRLERWSAATHRWHTYLNAGAGFTGEDQVVEWRPRIVGNPGWYRVVLSVGDERPLRSERFFVTC
ncbi:hypothetical protein [Streptosporangium longisporum]|uniref:Uncharacterized protein n=1 Tax=Streptosporangium longisporum TaxID=46187 RepID=A0ABN3XY83_9ACTN